MAMLRFMVRLRGGGFHAGGSVCSSYYRAIAADAQFLRDRITGARRSINRRD
jgi:hypothetical protein